MSPTILFRTRRFTGADGNSVVRWLGAELFRLGFEIKISKTDSLDISCPEGRYRIHINGSPERTAGEWRLKLERSRSVWDRLRGDADAGDGMLTVLKELLEMQADFSDIRQLAS